MFDFSEAASQRYGAKDYGREPEFCNGCDRPTLDCLCPAYRGECRGCDRLSIDCVCHDDGRCRKCGEYTDDCEHEREEEGDL